MPVTTTATADQPTQPDPTAAAALLEKAKVAQRQLDRWTAIEHLRKAFELNPADPQICFHLAYNLDLVGEEAQALSLYEQACAVEMMPVNAMMNLAVSYEDRGQFSKAERLLRLIVENNPNHFRARLFLKDVQSSRSMQFDEDFQKIREEHSNLVDTPVADFELSARARNCLKKMNVRSLGDLLRISEAELLAYKNFGETTLLEIKQMLSSRGLRIGQALAQQHSATRQAIYDQLRETSGDQAIGILTKPVDELDLSVRARKALDLLNIQTLGDLVSRTEAELLGIKNFGATSLDEIKEKLQGMGLSLRVLPPDA
jgi:DNA-directed RNA polymerase subunit alpha